MSIHTTNSTRLSYVNLLYDNFEECIMNKSVLNHKSAVKIFQWNIRGMNSLEKFDGVRELIDRYGDPIDVLVLGETWVKEGNQEMYNLAGYKSIFSCRARSNGGLVVYVRSNINAKIVEIQSQNGFHLIHLLLSLGKMKLNLIAVYRPPGFPSGDFLDKLEAKLGVLQSDQEVILLGDTNVPCNVEANSTVQEYVRLLSSFNLQVTNNITTRPASQNLLDHVVCSTGIPGRITNETVETELSDHSMILTSLEMKVEKVAKTLTTDIVNHELLDELFARSITQFPGEVSAAERLLFAINQYKEALESATRTVTVKAKVKGNCPWMTLELWQMIKIKEQVLKSSKQHPSNAHLRELVKHTSQLLSKRKAQSKRNYYYNLITTSTPTNSWKLINEVLGRSKKKDSEILVRDQSGVLKDNIQAANTLNKHFCEVGENLASSIPSDRNVNHFRTLTRHDLTIYMRPATSQEVIVLIGQLNPKKSPGPDRIPASFIKKHHLLFAELLKDAFNEMIETGVYPDFLKEARVVPIFKSGDPTDVNNYRPISTLSMLNKLLEQMVAARLSSFLDTHKHLYNQQYGFRKGSSTLTATCELLKDIYDSLDERKFCGALFLDLQKAFDTINHELLLQKLEFYGIRGKANSLLRSYLTNRMQHVSVNGTRSESRRISTGVPQGSNLGPLLFLVFINDLSRLQLTGKIRLFADDTLLLYSSRDCRTIRNNMLEDLTILNQYFASNLLSLNVSKTKFVMFHTCQRRVPELSPIRFGNQVVERVSHFKYLGLVLDETLSWEAHIQHLKRCIAPICGVIRKLASFIPSVWLLKLYFALVQSRLQYLALNWGTAAAFRLRELQTLQNRCLKSILAKPYLYPTRQLYIDAPETVLPVRGLHMQQTLVHMWNMLKDDATHHNLEFEIINSMTRQNGDIRIPRSNTELCKNRVTYVGSKLFNELPNDLKELNSKVVFKKNLRRHIKNNLLNALS